MRGSFIEIATLDGRRTLEQHQAHTVFHEQTGNVGKHAVLVFVRSATFSVIAHFRALHAQHLGVKLYRPLEVIAWQPDVIDLFNFHGLIPPFDFLYCNLNTGFKRRAIG